MTEVLAEWRFMHAIPPYHAHQCRGGLYFEGVKIE